MAYQTIRKNSLKKIGAELSGCVLITRYYDNDMVDDTSAAVTADMVMAESAGFDRVISDDEIIRVSIHSNYFFTGYKSADAVARRMTPAAAAKYGFAQQVAA